MKATIYLDEVNPGRWIGVCGRCAHLFGEDDQHDLIERAKAHLSPTHQDVDELEINLRFLPKAEHITITIAPEGTL